MQLFSPWTLARKKNINKTIIPRCSVRDTMLIKACLQGGVLTMMSSSPIPGDRPPVRSPPSASSCASAPPAGARVSSSPRSCITRSNAATAGSSSSSNFTTPTRFRKTSAATASPAMWISPFHRARSSARKATLSWRHQRRTFRPSMALRTCWVVSPTIFPMKAALCACANAPVVSCSKSLIPTTRPGRSPPMAPDTLSRAYPPHVWRG